MRKLEKLKKNFEEVKHASFDTAFDTDGRRPYCKKLQPWSWDWRITLFSLMLPMVFMVGALISQLLSEIIMKVLLTKLFVFS
ncbi:MAG: hypothetical protein FWH29_10790 [Methanobrevibacter sp.]|nr:hypothetical protein [Methanobrevibacter sp.]